MNLGIFIHHKWSPFAYFLCVTCSLKLKMLQDLNFQIYKDMKKNSQVEMAHLFPVPSVQFMSLTPPPHHQFPKMSSSRNPPPGTTQPFSVSVYRYREAGAETMTVEIAKGL